MRYGLIADPQIGISEGEDGNWERDVRDFEKSVEKINELDLDFVMILGDLVHEFPGTEKHHKQVECFLQVKEKIKHECYILAGNHDIGQHPLEDSSDVFEKEFGSSTRYKFEKNNQDFFVLDSQVFKVGDESAVEKELKWLENQVSNAKKTRTLFMHIPPFIKSVDEDDSWYNWDVL